MENEWVDCGNYWINNSPQLSDNWFEVKKGRPTSSIFEACVEGTKFSTPDNEAEILAGLKKKEITDEQKERMDHGIKTEPNARNWYMKTKNVKVKEIGLAVPKFDLRIGASSDGDVEGTEGIIEIKCPKKMYALLLKYMEDIKNGWVPPPFYHDHIWKSHYSQMQGCMAVLGKKWCDYIVYCENEKIIFTERIYYNEKYWNEYLYPGIVKFIESKLNPLLKDSIYPIIPSKDI